MDLTIRQATSADSETVRQILLEAARWLRDSGMEMWWEHELTAERISRGVESGLVYLAMYGDEPAGTLKFQLTDEQVWPDVPHDDSAFVHRLAVRRKYAGGEVSTALLQWAVDQAATLGKRYLRLDCDHARLRLRAVYERFGFRWHSASQVGPFHVARYEYPIGREEGVE